jgi:Ca-activated chloride channel family protein
MIHFAWPWMLLLLPLPWLSARYLPPAKPQADALFLPFAATVSTDWTPAPLTHSRRRILLFGLVWLLLIGAAVRPQWLGEPTPVPTTGRRVLMAIDTSGSMETRDMAEGYTRLQVVQAMGGDFISHRTGDQVGLILFGTNPYLQAPLTADLDTVGQFLRESMIGVAGPQTAIGDAIGLAIKRLNVPQSSQPSQSSPSSAEKKSDTVLILLTDGGNNAGMMDPIQAAKIAAAAGLRIYTIGVGADPDQGPFGGGESDLDEATLKSIAQITGGEYFRATDADALHAVYARLDQLEPSAGQAKWYRPSTEWFMWPLALALLLSVPAALMWRRT